MVTSGICVVTSSLLIGLLYLLVKGISRTVEKSKCHHCSKAGNIQKNCPKASVNTGGSMETTKPPDIKCYICDTKGHIAMHYPACFCWG